MEMRNKIMAHSDSEMMRMTTQAFDVPLREGDLPFVRAIEPGQYLPRE
jgi:hypothetical protein